MKKTLIAACVAVASAAAFAGINNVVISFSTPGPDKYSDGMPVIDGERYALVWTPEGSEFAGVKSDGTAEGDSKVVIAAPVAKDGCCLRVLFQVDEDYAAKTYPGGTWSVVMLDTRVFVLDADGKPVVDAATGLRAVKSCGAAGVANSYGVVGSAKAAKGGELGIAAGGVAASSASPVADAPAPVVKGISVDGDYVYVTITSTKPAFKYTLETGATPDSISEKADADAGFGSETKDIILVSPKKAGGEFFKVNCK